MNWRLHKTAPVALAMVSAVATGWSQTPTPSATTLYVSDQNWGGILKFDETGQMTIFASGISFPQGMAFDSSGNLYVGDGDTIKKYDPSGGMSVFASGVGAKGLAFDSNGVLYVASGDTIIKIDSAGQQTFFVTIGTPFGLAFDRNGNLYVTSTNANAIYKFDTSGNPTLFGNTGGYAPSGLAFDKGGNLYVATLQNNTILKFDSAGHGTVFATTTGGNPQPYGIAFDTAGNLYVAVPVLNKVEKFDSAGQGSFFASGMAAPYGIAIQPSAIPTHEYISGSISYCSNPSPGPVPNVTLTLTGDVMASATTDSVGNYQFSSLAAGGSYTVTPAKSALTPGSAGINTVDVIAVQRYYLNIAPLSGCSLTAADVNGNSTVDTVDVIAIQRFFLALSTGIANVGKYQFIPASRTYPGIVTDQTAQDYDTLIFGDVASHFVE